jgi:hypothetical protein
MHRFEASEGGARADGARRFRTLRLAIAALGCVFGGLLATHPASSAPMHAEGPHGHSDGKNLLTAADFKRAPRDLVLWGDLARAGVTRTGGRFHVTFLPPVKALEGKTVTLIGFMAPVHTGERHTQFLLSDRRFLCDACLAPPPPQSIVEVNARVAEPARERPITVRGALELVKDDPNGLLYRLNDAKVIRR